MPRPTCCPRRHLNKKMSFNPGSWDSSVGIATRYGLGGPGSIPAVQDFSLLHSVQTGSGAHPASYPMGTGGSFPGGKAVGARS
jgi:hypothetical protein